MSKPRRNCGLFVARSSVLSFTSLTLLLAVARPGDARAQAEASSVPEAELGSRAAVQSGPRTMVPVTVLGPDELVELFGDDVLSVARLRGLGPDRVTVLVNGKRWHQTAQVVVEERVGKGSSGYDLNALPVAAIERVEILRDSASAQYGPGAIAGVLNICLLYTSPSPRDRG